MLACKSTRGRYLRMTSDAFDVGDVAPQEKISKRGNVKSLGSRGWLWVPLDGRHVGKESSLQINKWWREGADVHVGLGQEG